MTTFRKYDHVEHLDRPEVAGIEMGTVHIFPKIDGTNASVWLDLDGMRVQAGSRTRQLTIEADNAGFCAWVNSDDPKAATMRSWLRPGLVVYGEWLVPHTLKAYRSDAWKRFWIFDVFDHATGRYVPWDSYGPILTDAGLDVVQPLCSIVEPSPAQLQAQVAMNTFLIADGAGVGEGIVIKNYAWMNRYDRQCWAKIVRNEFKEKHGTAFGAAVKHGEFQIEIAIAEEFCTPTLVGKTRAKIITDIASRDGIDLCQPNAQQDIEHTHRAKIIPQLLGRVAYDLVTEEIGAILRKHRKPVIDFGKLEQRIILRTKELACDLFGGIPKPACGPS